MTEVTNLRSLAVERHEIRTVEQTVAPGNINRAPGRPAADDVAFDLPRLDGPLSSKKCHGAGLGASLAPGITGDVACLVRNLPSN